MDFALADGGSDSRIHVFEPDGDIDLATAPELKQRLADVVAAGARYLIVDLRSVEFVDSTGLGVLLSIQRRVDAGGGKLLTVCTDRGVRRVFEIAGVAEV